MQSFDLSESIVLVSLEPFSWGLTPRVRKKADTADEA
jgi:hypothetical protein